MPAELGERRVYDNSGEGGTKFDQDAWGQVRQLIKTSFVERSCAEEQNNPYGEPADAGLDAYGNAERTALAS